MLTFVLPEHEAGQDILLISPHLFITWGPNYDCYYVNYKLEISRADLLSRLGKRVDWIGMY